MSARKRVVRFTLWLDPAFDRLMANEPEIDLRVYPAPATEAQAIEALREAHVYHCSSAKDELPQPGFVTASLLAHCPQLLCVSTYGAGYDPVDVEACTDAGVIVVNQGGGNAVSVAEHAIGLMLAVSHRIVEGDRRMRREIGYTREEVMGHEIAGTTLGLVGIGHTGTRVAALAHAIGLEVLAYDPYVDAVEVARRGARKVDFDELLARSNIVSLHCPRNRETLGMMDARAFARMPQGAIFVTTARGGIHDESALHGQLASGHLAGAGLDVWDREPPPLDHPLLQLPNVVATFHTAGVTHESRRNMATIAAEQIVALLRGDKPPRLVNPAAWPRFVERRAALGQPAAPDRKVQGGAYS